MIENPSELRKKATKSYGKSVRTAVPVSYSISFIGICIPMSCIEGLPARLADEARVNGSIFSFYLSVSKNYCE